MKTRTRVALAAAVALVSGQALAEMTPYFRLNRSVDEAAAPSTSPATQPSAQMTVGNPTSRTAYTGTGFAQPAPSVDNASSPVTWQLLSGGQDVSAGFQAVCPGLGFSTADGSISGNPSQACAPNTLQYKATSVPAGGGSPLTALSALFAINVLTPVVDVTPPSTSVKSGAPLTVTATTNIANPTWSVSGNPSWMPFTASGQSYSFSGTAGTVSSTQYSTLVITASSGGASPSGTAYVTVEPAQVQTGFPSGMTVRANKPMSIALTDPKFVSETWTATDNQQSVANLAISGGNLTGTPNGGFTSVAPTPYPYTTFINATSNRGTKYTGQLAVQPPITFAEYNNTVNRNGPINQPISYQPSLRYGIGTISYSLLYPNNMPTGMQFDPETGGISGTPSVFGPYTVGVLATDAYDNSTAQVQVNLNISLPQDIYFNGKTSSANYVYPYGPVAAGTYYVDVVLRNVTSKQVSLKLATASGDSTEPEAFNILLSRTSNGRGGFVDTVAHSQVPPYGGTEYYNYGASTPGSACAQYLNAGYYCQFRIVYKSSTAGVKNGYFSIQTENNTSTIPLKLTVQ